MIRSDDLTPQQISDIIERWKAGETLLQIARDYPTTYKKICTQTSVQRKKLDSLTPAGVQNALARWHEGDTFASIAADHQVCTLTLRRHIKPVKKASRQILTKRQIATVLSRYKLGEPIKKMAREYGIHSDKLRSLLMHECWRDGDTIESIAEQFRTSIKVARDRITKCVKLSL